MADSACEHSWQQLFQRRLVTEPFPSWNLVLAWSFCCPLPGSAGLVRWDFFQTRLGYISLWPLPSKVRYLYTCVILHYMLHNDSAPKSSTSVKVLLLSPLKSFDSSFCSFAVCPLYFQLDNSTLTMLHNDNLMHLTIQIRSSFINVESLQDYSDLSRFETLTERNVILTGSKKLQKRITVRHIDHTMHTRSS